VLHLSAGNLFGGVETYLLTLARQQRLAPEMEPYFGICFPGRLRDELAAAGVAVHNLGVVRVSRPWTILRGRLRLKRVMRANSFAAVATHGTWPHALFAPVIRRLGVRLVNVVHGEVTGRHWIDRWAARTLPDAVVANSRFTAGSVQHLFSDVPVKVCYPPVHLDEPIDRVTARQSIRNEFETPAEAVVILIVSRIEQLKGHAVLLEALGHLQKLPGWVCWVVGGAQRPQEEELLLKLRATADRLGVMDQLRFSGPRTDIPAVMAAADILCQPNTGAEGFGLVFVEALRSGLPIVTSEIGGAVEIVTDACGMLCPPRDAVAVALALRDLIVNPALRRKLSDAGPARVAELCDPARQMAELATVFMSVDSKKRSE
jgi:glycosyltransferase involved in cell wall biosynthesis